MKNKKMAGFRRVVPVYTEMAASSSNLGPCAACRRGRKKCTDECLFAPYFPPNNQQSLENFDNLHKVFSAGNVSRLLKCINPEQRQDTVNSLIYEAETRVLNPVYGCLGLISVLKHRLNQLYHELYLAQGENIGPYVILPRETQSVIREPQRLGPQQIAAVVAASEQQELLRFYEQQQQQFVYQQEQQLHEESGSDEIVEDFSFESVEDSSGGQSS
ncbi:hypothetical protein HHK36_030879 [Tetracentron sinense]|uniref:LOB domain-containing protein n=1 Tax=Tetracentron sinense TaxID=13715 RepID=A0A834Y8E3_TETSI|nr:hypothetical protein HHK36_030879 [Tetracentron sinense]